MRKYTKDGKFQDDLYFKEVYSKNVDIWGLLISYEILLPTIYGGNSRLTELQQGAVYTFIVDLIFNFVYSNPSEPIDINAVNNYISNFTKVLTGRVITPTAPFKSHSKQTKTRKKRTFKLPSNLRADSIVPVAASSKKQSIKPVIMDIRAKKSSPSIIKVVKHTAKRKRCPNGTRWDEKDQKCKSKYEKSNKKKTYKASIW